MYGIHDYLIISHKQTHNLPNIAEVDFLTNMISFIVNSNLQNLYTKQTTIGQAWILHI